MTPHRHPYRRRLPLQLSLATQGSGDMGYLYSHAWTPGTVGAMATQYGKRKLLGKEKGKEGNAANMVTKANVSPSRSADGRYDSGDDTMRSDLCLVGQRGNVRSVVYLVSVLTLVKAASGRNM